MLWWNRAVQADETFCWQNQSASCSAVGLFAVCKYVVHDWCHSQDLPASCSHMNPTLTQTDGDLLPNVTAKMTYIPNNLTIFLLSLSKSAIHNAFCESLCNLQMLGTKGPCVSVSHEEISSLWWRGDGLRLSRVLRRHGARGGQRHWIIWNTLSEKQLNSL